MLAETPGELLIREQLRATVIVVGQHARESRSAETRHGLIWRVAAP